MSPRGVATPEIRSQLFEAADRVMVREGPDGLTSRAVTDEAGCAKGMLHNHFDDFESFLAQFALDRIHRIVHQLEGLQAQAGRASVVTNLTDAAVEVFGSNAPAIASLITSRPSVFAKVQSAMTADGSPFTEIERSFAEYLEKEKKIGRVAPGADAKMLAFTIFGSLHNSFFMGGQRSLARARVREVVKALVGNSLTAS